MPGIVAGLVIIILFGLVGFTSQMRSEPDHGYYLPLISGLIIM